MSAAMRVIRRISSSLTIGLLRNPQTPLWMTRTPNPAAPGRPPARAPPPRPAPPRPPRPPPPNPPAASRPLPPAPLTPLLPLRPRGGAAPPPAGRVAAGVDAPRKAALGIRAAGLLRSAKDDVREPLER